MYCTFRPTKGCAHTNLQIFCCIRPQKIANVLHFWPVLGQSMPRIANRSVAHAPQICRMYHTLPMVDGVRPSDFDTTSVEGCSPSLAPSLIRSLAQSLIHSANRSPTPSFCRSLGPITPSSKAAANSEQRRAMTTTSNDRATTNNNRTTESTNEHQEPTTSND